METKLAKKVSGLLKLSVQNRYATNLDHLELKQHIPVSFYKLYWNSPSENIQ